MWLLFSVHDTILLLLSLRQIIDKVNVELALQQFLLLGIVPGTNLQISFEAFIFGLLAVLILLTVRFLYSRARKITKNINTLDGLPPNLAI